MSSNMRIVLALCTLAVVAACAKKEEMYTEQPVVSTEPVYTGKL